MWREKGAKIVDFLKKKPGLGILLIFLLIITIFSLKPQFYIVGWDNFSSYFNLPTNIFRTFFATWREYRGLGVASDSEATDIFRQLFYLISGLLLPKILLDQIYILISLNAGVIAMYTFGYLLFKKHLAYHINISADLFGFLSAFFYLFNLNTLATFYFPMIMYINRFALLPLTFLIFFLFLNKSHISKKLYFLFAVVFLVTSGAYITATNIITLIIALCIFGFQRQYFKRFVVLLLLYLSLQAFWLLPFLNYTLQKSNIIRLAPTFINANETLLNKGKSYYSIDKQLTLYPNFFDTEFYNITQTKKLHFHPLATLYLQPFYKSIFWIFPILYIAGSLLIFIKLKSFKGLIWIPSIIFLFLFLSFKEFSPLGFIYNILNNSNPYFGVLFRFGDTKFHPLIAFAGSLSAALAFVFLLHYVNRFLRYAIILVLLLSTTFVFNYYFKGELLGPFMYNRIPNAYFDMAKIINSDKDYFRVLHLPLSKEDYWKSYTWGLFGSSFFHYMIDKPFIDKTFEPASMENAYLNKKIEDSLANIQLMSSEKEKQEKAFVFASLLQKIGVKYLILDDTVAASVYPRGILLWGKFNNADVKVMLSYVLQLGLASEVKRYKVDLNDYLSLSDNLQQDEIDKLKQNAISEIKLIKLNKPKNKVAFLSKITKVDPKLNNLLETNLITKDKYWLQDETASDYMIFPFKRSNNLLIPGEDQYKIDLEDVSDFSKPFNILLPQKNSRETSTRFIQVYAQKNQTKLILSFFVQQTPDVSQTKNLQDAGSLEVPLDDLGNYQAVMSGLYNYISDWSFLPQKKIGALRLKVGNYVIPLPIAILENPVYIATVAVSGDTFPVELLTLQKRNTMDLHKFSTTDNPNCFFDKLTDASYKTQVTKESVLNITSQNQSTCIVSSLKPFLGNGSKHMELQVRLNGASEDLDSRHDLSFAFTSKPKLKQFVTGLSKPNMFRLCAKEPLINDCYNLHQFIDIQGETLAVFPLEKPIGDISNMDLMVSLKNTGYQKQSVNIKEISLNFFKDVVNGVIILPKDEKKTIPLVLGEDKKITLTFPKALSQYSFFFDPNKETLYGYNPVCGNDESYRTFRRFSDKLLAYSDNCYYEIFQKANFSSNNFYLWTLSYNLLSGKYPRFVIGDNVYSYADEYVSLNQGYPDVLGFKSFEAPEMWYENNSQKSLEKKISKLQFSNAYGYLNPQAGLGDLSNKDFTIHQDSENEGVLMVDSFFVEPLPTQWSDLAITDDLVDSYFSTPKSFEFKQFLPSLWKVGIDNSLKGKTMLFFNEGFDTKWRAYDSIWGVLFGFGNQYEPKRCDGYANCFLINQSKAQTFYLFYTPERLNFLGWVLTLLGAVLFWKFLKPSLSTS